MIQSPHHLFNLFHLWLHLFYRSLDELMSQFRCNFQIIDFNYLIIHLQSLVFFRNTSRDYVNYYSSSLREAWNETEIMKNWICQIQSSSLTLTKVSLPPATWIPIGWFSSFNSMFVFWFGIISQVNGSCGTSLAGEGWGFGVTGRLGSIASIPSFVAAPSPSFLLGLQTVNVTMPSVFFNIFAAVS